MELLRIVAMIIIMLVHANFRALGYPTADELTSSPQSTFLRYMFEGFCILGVNVFVMLSGWYGIKFKPLRLGALAFQIFFFIVLITLTACVIEKRMPNVHDIGFFLLKRNYDYWFVKAYLMMYIMAPVMNAFVEKATKQQFRLLLCCFFGFTFLYGWFLDGAVWLKHGHSGLFFMGLYLLARYMRLHATFVNKTSKVTCVLIYIFTALVIAIIAYVMLRSGHQKVIRRLYYYTCPLVILQALAFLILFSKISIKSKFINWVASSMLAIYLTHSSPFIGNNYYDANIASWYSSETSFMFACKLAFMVFITFWISVLLDKVRLFIWNTIINLKHKNSP